jgi:hypothetical protein
VLDSQEGDEVIVLGYKEMAMVERVLYLQRCCNSLGSLVEDGSIREKAVSRGFNVECAESGTTRFSKQRYRGTKCQTHTCFTLIRMPLRISHQSKPKMLSSSRGAFTTIISSLLAAPGNDIFTHPVLNQEPFELHPTFHPTRKGLYLRT